MLKNKVFEFISRKKKETIAVALGVVVLGVVGVGCAFMLNSTTDSSKVVENVELKEEKVDEVVEDVHVHDENCNHEHEDEGVENSESVEVATETTSNTENKSEVEKSEVGSSNSNSKNEDTNKEETKKEDNKKTEITTSADSSKPSTGSSSSTPVHNHNWVAITSVVNHPEEGRWDSVLVKEAWVEEVPVYETKEVMICNACGADITSLNDNDYRTHMMTHMLNGEKGSWRSEWKQVQTGTNKINHDAVYEKKWVVTKPAWSETVTTGHKCSGCGATK